MTQKELKKLNRYQLLELLVTQTERADSLERTVRELEERLAQRELRFSQMGSVAEAAMYVSGVFDSAQKAANLYLDAARKRADELLENAQQQAELIISQAREQAGSLTAPGKNAQKEPAGKRMTNEKAKNKRASKNRRAKR